MPFSTTQPRYSSPFERSPRALQGVAKPAGRAHAASYLVPLRKPTEVLMENSNDRPDVATIAILGYN